MGDSDGSGSGWTTLAATCAIGCLIVILISLVDLLTMGSLFWTLVLLGGGIAGCALLLLSRIKPGELAPHVDSVAVDTELDDEEVDDDDDEAEGDIEDDGKRDEGALRGDAGEPPAPARLALRKVPDIVKDDEFERMIAADGDFERVLTGPAKKKSEPRPAPKPSSKDASDFERRLERLRTKLGATRRNRNPLEWAAVMHNIGGTQLLFGEYLCNTGRFGEAIEGLARFKDAVHSYREALKERTLDRSPHDHAVTQARLGEALVGIARHEPRPDYLVAAIASLTGALSILEPETRDATRAQEALDAARRIYERRDADKSEEPWSEF